MELVSASSFKLQSVYYLSHHGVLRDSSTTIKLRVVFNGSHARQCIAERQSPHRRQSLASARRRPFALALASLCIRITDIEKMYRQILG